MCVSITMLVATYLVYMSKVRRHTVSCRLLKIYNHYCVDLLKTFCLGDIYYLPAMMISDLALLDKNTPMVLDTIRNGIVYEPLARSDDYLN